MPHVTLPARSVTLSVSGALVIVSLSLGMGYGARSNVKQAQSKPIDLRVNQTRLSGLNEAFMIGQSPALLTPQGVSHIGRVEAGKTTYAVVNVECTSPTAARSLAEAHLTGIWTLNCCDRFVDTFVEMDRQNPTIPAPSSLASLRSFPGVVWSELAGTVLPPPVPGDVLFQETKAPLDPIVHNGVGNLTGKNVIIAVLDSGVDFRNPDFIRLDEEGRPTSRLLYLWDTTSDAYANQHLGTKPPLTYPNGTPIGTLYTRDQLTQELRSHTVSIPPTDLNGHGTCCAGIAAGNGRNAPNNPEVVGVAPNADIVAVRLGGLQLSDGTVSNSIENACLLNAVCSWLDTIAGTQPLVVSCSFGSHAGGHDGNLIAERELNARFATSAHGRAIVIAAGNERNEELHACVTCGGASHHSGTVVWGAPADAQLALYLGAPSVSNLKITPKFDTQVLATSGEINPITHQYQAFMRVSSGVGGLTFTSTSKKELRVDCYITGGNFKGDCVSRNNIVSSPGTTANAITVGSYDWNDKFNSRSRKSVCEDTEIKIRALSCYSSAGYSRNGNIKPDLVAPGEYFSASYAKHPDGTGVLPEDTSRIYVDKTGNYRIFNGTSAATPYTAGVIALMLEKSPGLAIADIKRRLMTATGHPDSYTGPLPNPSWGYGRLDLGAVKRVLTGLNASN